MTLRDKSFLLIAGFSFAGNVVARSQEPVRWKASELATADLTSVSVSLRSLRRTELKEIQTRDLQSGAIRQPMFTPELVIFRREGDREVSAVHVSRGSEIAAAKVLSERSEVEFATVDRIQSRQFVPSDANLNFQWHHGIVNSFGAWKDGLGSGSVRIAIVDSPFQMNHPDLIENVDTGWDVTDEMPILTAVGDAHSTGSAGMAAAVINNGVGVAGAANCRLVPIGITGATSEMYQAVLWAADHNIRVVNISWTGANEPVMQAAGEYLREQVEGVLVMPGLNDAGQAGFINQPDILCISMTDAADNMRSLSGPHIDFAAPGWDVYTTTANSGYGTARGTSFAAPLFAGVVAMVMSINPALTAAQTVEMIRVTSDDKGNPGWDEGYGWGRVNFGAAVAETVTSLPRVASVSSNSGGIEIGVEVGFSSTVTLERKGLLNESDWVAIGTQTNGGGLTIFRDVVGSEPAMYRALAERARQSEKEGRRF